MRDTLAPPNRPLRSLRRRALALVAATAAAGVGACGAVTNPPFAAPFNRDSTSVVLYDMLMTNLAATPLVSVRASGRFLAGSMLYLAESAPAFVTWTTAAPVVDLQFTNPAGGLLLGITRTFVDSSAYAVAAVGVYGATDPALQPVVVLARRDTALPAAGKVRVRFLHALPGIGAIDVWAGPPGGEVRIVQGVAFAGVSAYVDITIPGGPSNLVVTNAGVTPLPATNVLGPVSFAPASSHIYFVPLVFATSNYASAAGRTITISTER